MSAKTKRNKKPGGWRTKLPASMTPAIHPLQIYRSGRLAQLFDTDKSTIWRWRKDGTLPPFTKIGGVEGLTGQQLLDLYAGCGEAHNNPTTD